MLAFIKVVKSCFHPDKVLFFENPEADASGSRSALYSAACSNGIVQGIFKEGVQVGKSDKGKVVRLIAKTGGLSEQEIREFDKQVMEPDSLILIHLGKLKSFAAGQKDGILTRDYICLYNNNMPRVLKLDRLTEAHLKDNTYYIKVGKTHKKAHYLTINLMSKDNKTAWAETSQESARALQEELANRCPGIDTADGAVLAE